MQCIFIVNNNIQKKKEGREKGKVSFTEKNKRFAGGGGEQAKQTKHKHKPNLT